MNFNVIEPEMWQPYFNFFSKYAQGRHLEVEFASPDFGDQVPQEWTLMGGLSYSPREDILYIHTDTIEHAISSPRIIAVNEYDPARVEFISIKDAEGDVQVLRFRQPQMLRGIRPD